MPTPKQFDPTGTTRIRMLWMAETNRRFAQLEKAIRTKVVDMDYFGRNSPVQNAQYDFPISADKIGGFMDWLEEEQKKNVLQTVPGLHGARTGAGYGKWTDTYVDSSYRKGLVDGYLSVKEGVAKDVPGSIPAKAVSQFESPQGFMATSMAMPVSTRKLSLLHQRVFTDLKGVTSSMDAAISRNLTSGMLDGKGPADIARQIVKDTEVSKKRALMIARTETIRAHAEAKLDTFEAMGVEGVSTLAEWSTAGDDKVCEVCQSSAEDVDGNPIIYDLNDARGRIPAHPNCRCSWLPYFPPEEEKKKVEPDVEAAVAEPVAVEPDELETESEYEIDEPRIEKVIREVHAGTAELDDLEMKVTEAGKNVDTIIGDIRRETGKMVIGNDPRYMAALDEKVAANRAYKEATNKFSEKVLTAIQLPPEEQKKVPTTLGPVSPTKDVRVKSLAAADELSKVMVVPSGMKSIPVNMQSNKKRAYHDKFGIHVSLEDDKSVYMHEMLHDVEYNDANVRERIREFLLHRTKGTKLTKMGDGEYGHKDNFIDTYTGKVYRKDKHDHLGMPSNMSSLYGTEVLSMWATNMYSTSALRLKFIREDPQTFEFGLRVLQRDWKGADAILADLRKITSGKQGAPQTKKAGK